MKTIQNYSFVVFIVAILSLFLAVSDSKAEVRDIGEVCFNLASDTNRNVQLGILSYGAGYFSLNGKITDEDSKIMPAVGTAVIDAYNRVLLTLSTTYGFAYSETFNIAIDLETLSGSFSSIVHTVFFSGPPPTPDQVVSRYDIGEVTVQSCPK